MPSKHRGRLQKLEQAYNLKDEGTKLLLKLPAEIRPIIRDMNPDELFELARRLRTSSKSATKRQQK